MYSTVPYNSFPASSELLNKLDEWEVKLPILEEDVSDLNEQKANQITIAQFFNSESSYDVGDLVYYNGFSYRCTNAHEGEWDADDFAPTTIANELDTLKSGLIDIDTKYITTYKNTIENVVVGDVEYGSEVLTTAGLYLINATIETNSADERTLHLKAESDSVGVVFYGIYKIKGNASYGGILELSVIAYIPANSTIKFTGYAYSAGDNLTVNASFCRLASSIQ